MKTRTFELNKLVRDKIVESTENEGGSAEYRVIEGEELTQAEKDKLLEELGELMDGPEPDLEKLADIREVLDALAVQFGYSKVELDAAQYDKRRRIGGFTAGHFVEMVTVPEDSELAEYYSSDPTRFPEVKNG